jgi:hypothetical protein
MFDINLSIINGAFARNQMKSKESVSAKEKERTNEV